MGDGHRIAVGLRTDDLGAGNERFLRYRGQQRTQQIRSVQQAFGVGRPLLPRVCPAESDRRYER